jgi:hypothetical protein
MSNKPVKTFSSGSISLAVWQGDYQGKPTLSATIKKQKYDSNSKTYNEVPYYNKTDIQDVIIVSQAYNMWYLEHAKAILNGGGQQQGFQQNNAPQQTQSWNHQDIEVQHQF